MDYRMPVEDGIEVTREVLKIDPDNGEAKNGLATAEFKQGTPNR
jgi:CheY-like chemotaxis protein